MEFVYEKLTGSGGFFERKRFKNHHQVFFLIFDARPECVVGEAFEVVACGSERTNFFGDYYSEATHAFVVSARGVREINDHKARGCDSFGARAKLKKLSAKGEFARVRDHKAVTQCHCGTND